MRINAATTLMIQGTTSDAGKSTLVTGLCRALVRGGFRVAPFKPQNMALNSVVTIDGGEIGRAQAVQARAAMLEPHTDMNPVLLKPNTDIGAQVIIQGKAIGNFDASEYHHYKKTVMEAVLGSYRRLCQDYDIVLVEGAGSPAEINLRKNDIANMGFAEAVDCPVLLIADIDRGGVFAHLVGTLELLRPSEVERVKGLVINRFRGDLKLLRSGLDWLEDYTKKPVTGVIPHLENFHLEAEDSFFETGNSASKGARLKILCPITPRISNHTDLDPLRLHPEVDLVMERDAKLAGAADLIILSGSKSVCADLAWLGETGWVETIQRHLRYGGKLLGICGGFQMLGKQIDDPFGTEGFAGSSQGLGLLDITTTLGPEKRLNNVTGYLYDGAKLQGYEIHTGKTQGNGLQMPFCQLEEGPDGAVSKDHQIYGTYVHGLFESSAACRSILKWAGLKNALTIDYAKIREESIDRMADAILDNLDMAYVLALLENNGKSGLSPHFSPE